ncbi:MAG TPA: hypothetical protein VGX92_11625 [Pyrinomonadaceae bacterium]|nr:hypothetical protein [Pyrinomonadaceae bacterium]
MRKTKKNQATDIPQALPPPGVKILTKNGDASGIYASPHQSESETLNPLPIFGYPGAAALAQSAPNWLIILPLSGPGQEQENRNPGRLKQHP